MKTAKIHKLLLASLMTMVFSLTAANFAQAQKYRFAAGWRAGSMTNGVTVKVIPVKGVALEGILNVYPYGPSIGGMIERTRPVLCIEALQVYAGVGAHYRWAYMDGEYFDPINGWFAAYAPPGTRGVGLDAVAGIELKIPLLPVAISAEVKPMIEWTDMGGVLYGLDPGLGLKVAF